MIIKIKNIPIHIWNEGTDVKVKVDEKTILLCNQDVHIIYSFIKHNFDLVYEHYLLLIKKSEEKVNLCDIAQISIIVVLHYLYMHNMWKNTHRELKEKTLEFNQQDLLSTTTNDIIFSYFRGKYPSNWEQKCAALLGFELSELKNYYLNRQNYYNK